jgi:hypothetical protein
MPVGEGDHDGLKNKTVAHVALLSGTPAPDNDSSVVLFLAEWGCRPDSLAAMVQEMEHRFGTYPTRHVLNGAVDHTYWVMFLPDLGAQVSYGEYFTSYFFSDIAADVEVAECELIAIGGVAEWVLTRLRALVTTLAQITPYRRNRRRAP